MDTVNSMMKVIYDEDLYDKEYIKEFTENFDAFIKVIKEFDIEEGAKICGCEVEEIKTAASKETAVVTAKKPYTFLPLQFL